MKINLVEILKDAPSGTKLYSLICGEVEFEKISQKDKQFPIVVRCVNGDYRSFYTSDAKFSPDGECCLFPSKENRDWNSVVYERKVFKNECQIVIKEGRTKCNTCPFNYKESICTVKSIKGIPDCKKYDLSTMEIVGFEHEE